MLSAIAQLEVSAAALLRKCSTLSPETAALVFLSDRERVDRRVDISLPAIVVPKVDDWLARLHDLQNTISSARQLLFTFRSVTLHGSSRIFALPLELLSVIFEWACRSDPSRTARTLSHTCARWRHLILSTPKHWSTIPVSANDLTARLSEYMKRPRDEPLSLVVLPSDAMFTPISIPPSVSQRLTSVRLTNPDLLDTLYLPKGTELHSLHLDKSEDPSGIMEDYAYTEEINERFPVLGVQSLTCNGVGISRAGSSLADVHFSRLQSLHLEQVTSAMGAEALNRIKSPVLDIVRLVDMAPSTIPPFLFHAASVHFRHLHIVGNAESVGVAGIMLRYCVATDLVSLHLRVHATPGVTYTPSTWVLGMSNVFDFAIHAATIVVGCIPSLLRDVIEAMRPEELDGLKNLTSLTIVPLESTEGQQTQRQLAAARSELERFVDERGDEGRPLDRLSTSRLIVQDGEEWFADRVGTLELLDYGL